MPDLDYQGIAAKLRERTPTPNVQMIPEQFILTSSIYALADALEAMATKEGA